MKSSTVFTRLYSATTAAAISLALGFSTQASAEETQAYVNPAAATTASVSINFAESDLATAEGRAVVEHKIKRAAEKVCGPTSYREAGSLAAASHNRKCVEAAMATAVSQLDSSQVATLSN